MNNGDNQSDAEGCPACKHDGCKNYCVLSRFFPLHKEDDLQMVYVLIGDTCSLRVIYYWLSDEERLKLAETLVLEARICHEYPAPLECVPVRIMLLDAIKIDRDAMSKKLSILEEPGKPEDRLEKIDRIRHMHHQTRESMTDLCSNYTKSFLGRIPSSILNEHNASQVTRRTLPFSV